MDDITTRVAILEDNHQDLKQRITATEQTLTAIRAEQADIRRDMNAGLTQVQTALTGVTTGALNSLPQWAAEAQARMAAKAEADAHTKGILMGVAVSLLGVIAVLIIAVAKHGGL